MNPTDIEKEIQARVEFKMNELLTAVKNTALTNWSLAFQENSPKHSHYWEAFSQMSAMLHKEMNMATPVDYMFDLKKREKRDEAIESIMERFGKQGERDYHQKERFLVKVIEKAQNY